MIYRRPICHVCIGGSLDELIIRSGGKIKDNINKFNVNWVESKLLQERLQALGAKNVEYLPNFKRLNKISVSECPYIDKPPFVFCTFSRVRADKGIGVAAQAIIDINREYKEKIAELHVYGPYEEGYQNTLQQYISVSNGAIIYKGIINHHETVCALKNYFMLLFPTTFPGEGFPGTILDAFHSGLPVIATDWNLNSEIIKNEITGFLYSYHDQSQLKVLMDKAMRNPCLIYEMRKNCLLEAEIYSVDKALDIIFDKVATLVGGC